MNSTPEAADSSEPASKPKKKISAQRRIISWIFIGILLVVVLVEWRAQSSHGSTVKNLDLALDASEPVGEVPFSKFESFKQGDPSVDIDKSGVLNRKHHYQWKGLFKVYHLRLLVDAKDNIIIYDTLADGDSVGGIKMISKKNHEAIIKEQREASQGKPAETEESKTEEAAEKKPEEKEAAEKKPAEKKNAEAKKEE